MPTWDPDQYLKFADERTRAARDLLAQVPLKEAKIIYDLGCGPGNSTELLLKAYSSAQIIGVDNSPEMLKQARTLLPSLQFEEADLQAWKPTEDADLLFSNATFQWVPDQVSVLQQLLKGLKAGGVLAVQMPDNRREPSHVAMEDAARNTSYASKLLGVARGNMPSPSDYYAALKPHCSRLDIWHTIYNHPLKGAAAIVEWVKGTGLRPFLAPLNQAEQSDYLVRYEALLVKAYPAMADGMVLLRFPRLFFVATK